MADIKQIEVGDSKFNIAGAAIVLEDNSTTTAGTWLAKTSQIDLLVDGQLFLYKITKAGGASATTLNITSTAGPTPTALGAKTIYRSGTTKLTTQYGVGQYVLLTYNSTDTCFRVVNDYDANSTSYVRYDINTQGLSDTQKSNARTNIGAGTSSFSGSYNDLSNKPTIPATNVIPATTTASKLLVSTTTSGTAKWSDFSSAGLLKTNTSGVISVDTNSYLTTSGTAADSSKLGNVAAANYIQKSNTAGLIKNDGTIDTTVYSTFTGYTSSNKLSSNYINVEGSVDLNNNDLEGVCAISNESNNFGIDSDGWIEYFNNNPMYIRETHKTNNVLYTTSLTTNSEEARTKNTTYTFKEDGLYLDSNKITYALGTTSTTAAAGNHAHGNITNTGNITTSATIASGDALIIQDSSASKLVKSTITFDSADENNYNTYLSKHGTWETVGDNLPRHLHIIRLYADGTGSSYGDFDFTISIWLNHSTPYTDTSIGGMIWNMVSFYIPNTTPEGEKYAFNSVCGCTFNGTKRRPIIDARLVKYQEDDSGWGRIALKILNSDFTASWYTIDEYDGPEVTSISDTVVI